MSNKNRVPDQSGATMKALEAAILGGNFATHKDLEAFVSGVNGPVYAAFVEDLIALMHRYGIYWHLSGPTFTEEAIKNQGPLEIGFDGENVRFDTAGDLSKGNQSSKWPIRQLKPPTAHQKMEQVAFRRAILAGQKP